MNASPSTTPSQKSHASHVDLAGFTSQSLLQELERRGYGGVPLGGASNAAIFDELQARGVDDDAPQIENTFDLVEAIVRFRRGEIADAFHHLERALPTDFAGISALAPSSPHKAAA